MTTIVMLQNRTAEADFIDHNNDDGAEETVTVNFIDIDNSNVVNDDDDLGFNSLYEINDDNERDD